MFKLVAILAFVAAASAEPGVVLSTPYVQPYAAYSPVAAPAVVAHTSVVQQTPLAYSTPLAFSHFIKKRSADPQLLATTYNAGYNLFPASYQYPAAAAILPATTYNTPLTTLPVAAHLIKKRSATLLSTPYVAPTTYVAPAISSPLISTPYVQAPYYGAQLPLVNTHFIKKRSAEPAADPQTFISPSYLAPSTYINTVATPYVANPLLNSYYPAATTLPLATTHLIKKRSAEPAADPQTFISPSYLAPSTYINTVATPYIANPFLNSYYSAATTLPLATTHLIKKRAAEAEPEPAADPQLALHAFPSAYYPGAAVIPAYRNAAVFKTAPLYTANPFVYSSFIKK